MKTFRLIGMALLAVLMCANFTACSSDDDENGDNPVKNEDGIITNQKKLMEIKEVYKDDSHTDSYTYSLSYDSKGKLIAFVGKGEEGSDITNITWAENTIKETSDGESITYSLTDGLVRTGSETDDKNYSFAYNSSKQLTTYQYGSKYSSSTRTLSWENDRVTKIVYSDNHDDDEISEITYGNQTCKGYFPLMALMVEDDFKTMLAHPELVGMRTTQLPDQSYNKEVEKGEHYDDYFKETFKYENISEETVKFTYKLNSDGYLESLTTVETDIETYKISFEDKNGDGVISDDERNVSRTNTYTYTTIFTFKWE